MKFREHRGGYDESMATLVEVSDRSELIRHCRELLAPYAFEFCDEDLDVRPYTKDARDNWDTHIVTIARYGVIGYTDCPCEN